MNIKKQIYVVLASVCIALFLSCKNESKQKRDTTNVGDASITLAEEVEEVKSDAHLQTLEYILKKITDFRNENNKEYLIYETEIGNELLTCYTKGSYAVLQRYNENEDDLSDYYIFPKLPNTAEELTVRLKNALFYVTAKEIDVDYTEVSHLLEKYLILAIRGDTSYPSYAIIDIEKQKLSGQFVTHGDFTISPDEKFLMGWQDSETNTDKDSVCPEYKSTDTYDAYVVTEEFKYELSTGKETKTGKLGCGLVQ